MKLETGIVLEQVKLSDEQFILSIKCPEIVATAKAGQFVTLQVSKGIDPLIRRPISIHDIDRENGLLVLYYQVVGKGTEILSQYKQGEEISVLGPLGNGFDVELANAHVALVGGGIGQAPLLHLAKQLHERGNKVTVIMGSRDESGLRNLDYYKEHCHELLVATEDGSLGEKGFITSHLQRVLDLGVERVYTCGPHPMLKAVKEMTVAANTPCQVSLEEKMACGIGVCLGCTCKSTKHEAYPKVCNHGPVFWAEEVDLND